MKKIGWLRVCLLDEIIGLDITEMGAEQPNFSDYLANASAVEL